MLVSLVAAAAVLAGSDPDQVMATAPETPVSLDVPAGPVAPSVGAAALQAAPHGLTTDQQIDRWLAARDPNAAPFAESDPTAADREPHAMFDVSVGTDGYRDYGAAVSLPLGEQGRLDLAFRQVENGYGYRSRWGDPALDDAGYAFPGVTRPGAAMEYEWRLARPEGPPQRRRR